MIEFKASDPFPLVEGEVDSFYNEAQIHSQHVDEWLGLQIDAIERDLVGKGQVKRPKNSSGVNHNLWIGLDSKRLLTPYAEFRRILCDLRPQEGTRIVDLGAAYGRLAFVLKWHYPRVYFTGYEFVGERVDEGRRVLEKQKCVKACLLHQDLSEDDFVPEIADIYFIYDYGERKAISKTVHDLRELAKKRRITVVARGRSARDLIEREHPWLAGVYPVQHTSHYSIYQSGLKLDD